MKATRFFAWAFVLILLVTLGGSAGAEEPQQAGNGGCAAGGSYDPACDVNRDGDMDIIDLGLVATHWGQAGTWTSDSWSLSGNSGATAGTNFLGTTDNQDLVIKTNGAEAMRVDANGNVGIGTTNPASPLAVSRSSGMSDNQFLVNLTNMDPQGAQGGVLLIKGGSNSVNSNTLEIQDYSGNTDFIIKGSGKVGIGTTGPAAKLDVASEDNIVARFGGTTGFGGIEVGHDGGGILFRGVGTAHSSIYYEEATDTIHITGDTTLFGDIDYGELNVAVDGKVGVGTTNPASPLEVVRGSGMSDNQFLVNLTNLDPQDAQGSVLLIKGGSNSVNSNTLEIQDYSGNTDFIVKGSGNVGIGTTDPQELLHVAGRARTNVLEITGGSDLAEPFEIAGAENVEPGMVVVIDPEHPGQLRIASRAYDRTVAGCVSGANGVNPGLTMQQEGTVAEGAFPVALSGRVYCWADASYGPIQPGDLLTTSDTAGHLMKVTDYPKAQGAIVGKAMGSLEYGQGLVLVLVTLQ